MTGIRYSQGRQWIRLELTVSRGVMANIIGILFRKPDRVIGCDCYSHNSRTSVWWRNLLKFLRVGIKDSKEIMTHLTEPDTTRMVNGGRISPLLDRGNGYSWKVPPAIIDGVVFDCEYAVGELIGPMVDVKESPQATISNVSRSNTGKYINRFIVISP